MYEIVREHADCLVTYRELLGAILFNFFSSFPCLFSPNCKVAARDKQFFSRQSSNTSKSSFVSSASTYVSITPAAPARKSVPMIPVPLLRVLESSNQDLTTCDAHSGKDTNSNDDRSDSYTNTNNTSIKINDHHNHLGNDEDKNRITSSPEQIIPDRTNFLGVPDFIPLNLPRRETSSVTPKPGLALRRCSTPLIPLNVAEKSFDSLVIRESDERKQSFATPQMRRKSSNDVFVSIFHGRNSEPPTNTRSGEEPLLLQMLRRQHHRTLRILIILLLVFVICRAPRAIILLIGWLQSRHLCQSTRQAYLWLHYSSLWAHTSAVFDTIVYGFWGNRAYRTRLRHWYSKCMSCTKHEIWEDEIGLVIAMIWNQVWPHTHRNTRAFMCSHTFGRSFKDLKRKNVTWKHGKRKTIFTLC